MSATRRENTWLTACLVVSTALAAPLSAANFDRPPPASGYQPARRPTTRDWMDIRRGGAAAVLQDARKSSAPLAWTATWAVQPASDEDAKATANHRLTLQVTRTPPQAGAPRGRTLVQVLAPASLRGVGVLADESGVWIKTSPDAAAAAATDASLAAVVPGLGLPLAVFVAGEWQGQQASRTSYEVALEGEFGDTAVIRFKPQYEAGPQTPILKAGVSKRFGTWTLGELDDRNGKPLAKVEWLDVTEREGGAPIAELVRLLPASGTALTLQRVSHRSGAGVAWVGGAKGLGQLK